MAAELHGELAAILTLAAADEPAGKPGRAGISGLGGTSAGPRVLRARLKKVVAARVGVIHVRDVDPREPWPDGRDRPQDQAISI
jgi:hypothetical protein